MLPWQGFHLQYASLQQVNKEEILITKWNVNKIDRINTVVICS